jgi:hypothetical protein
MIIYWAPREGPGVPEINSAVSTDGLLHINGSHYSAQHGNGDHESSMINSRCVVDGKKCGRRRRPGRVPIIAAIITAIGAVTAAVVAGVFHLLG